MNMISGPVLLVEDNDDEVFLMLRSFKKNNFANNVIVASDGEEALDYLLGRNGKEILRPVLILMDLKLPRLNGFDVLREIRKSNLTILTPVVILTSSSEKKDIVQSYNLGVNSYVRKPVDFKEFANLVGHLGKYWLILNRLPLSKH